MDILMVLYLFPFRVQYHDSYKFNAKSYHSMQYHFKSIDTWLKGICKSHCPEHAWKRTKYQPGKKSIFAENQANETPDEDAEQEAEVDFQNNDGVESKNLQCQLSHDLDPTKNDKHVCGNQNAIGRSLVSNTVNKPLDDAAPLQDVSSIDSFASTKINSISQRPFHDLDECVQWLLSKISFELESDLDYERSTSEVEAADSLYITDKEETFRTAASGLSVFPRNSCFCPQCCHINMNCIHQDDHNFADVQKGVESEFGSLEDFKDLSSSLECFDLVSSEVVSSEVVSIVQCPNNSNSNSTRQSVSPSKVPAKRGKGKY